MEVEIDTWPRIPTYLEVEANSKEAVINTLKQLGYTEEDTTSKPVKEIYQDYGSDLRASDELRF